jgi:hypothetical protein
MAYSGSTAASTIANPPSRISHGILAQRSVAESTSVNDGGSLWVYNSTNTTTAMYAAGFFTDGVSIGMRPGDIMISRCSSGEGSTAQHVVIGILQSTDGIATNLTTAGTMSSTFA